MPASPRLEAFVRVAVSWERAGGAGGHGGEPVRVLVQLATQHTAADASVPAATCLIHTSRAPCYVTITLQYAFVVSPLD